MPLKRKKSKVQESQTPGGRKSRRSQALRGNRLIIVVASLIIVVDLIALGVHIYQDHKHQEFIAAQILALGSKNVPSSVKPTPQQVASYQVAPKLPKYLIIPALNVDARVQKLYTNAQNQVEAPSNIFDTGWYDQSSLPGQPGAMFIDGHVSSWTADGVFYNLKKLKPGDDIEVIRGDNTKFTYVVKQVQSYGTNNVNMSQVLSPIDPGTAALNLMTCTGSVIAGTSQFNERLVVYSELTS